MLLPLPARGLALLARRALRRRAGAPAWAPRLLVVTLAVAALLLTRLR